MGELAESEPHDAATCQAADRVITGRWRLALNALER